MDILLILLGLGLILGGANYLTDGAAAVAQRLRMPEFIIGLTVIAVGTSMPELIVSTLSAIEGKSGMAIGNVVGSDIFNILVILGICALIRPVVLTSENIRRDIPLGLAAALILLAVTLGRPQSIGRIEGIVMMLIYIGIMWYTVRTTPRPAVKEAPVQKTRIRPEKTKALSDSTHTQSEKTKARSDNTQTLPEKTKALWLVIIMIAGGLAGLILGGEFFLRGATSAARHLGVSESVIAITLVAGGTSLPELASSIVSLLKGKAEMALGNVIGSNIANILLVLGLSATIHPLSMGGITMVDIGMIVLSTALLFLTAFTFRRRTIDRWEGAIFVAVYTAYIFYLLK